MFTLTPAAAGQILRAAKDGETGDMPLRVAALRGKDGALQYGMGFDDARDGDMTLEIEGVAVLIASPSQVLLQDTVLDYVELEPGSFNFIFMEEPSAADAAPAPSSGCGSGAGAGCASGGCASKKGTMH